MAHDHASGTAEVDTSQEAAPAPPEQGTLTLQDVLIEPGMLLGAGTAVMYQLAYHGVGKGVAEHSETMHRPLDRLRTTLTYLYVLGLGTDEERAAIIRMVNKAHVPVRGEGYSAFDPRLQLWVAATLSEVGKQMYDRLFGPMGPADAERVYREGWIYGTALQVKEEMWPQTRADFDRWWAEMEQDYRSDDQVRAYAHGLISIRRQPWYNKPLVPLISLLTRGGLSPAAREALGFEWSPTDERLHAAFWAVTSRAYRLIPAPVRQAPTRVVMWDVRRRFRTGTRII